MYNFNTYITNRLECENVQRRNQYIILHWPWMFLITTYSIQPDSHCYKKALFIILFAPACKWLQVSFFIEQTTDIIQFFWTSTFYFLVMQIKVTAACRYFIYFDSIEVSLHLSDENMKPILCFDSDKIAINIDGIQLKWCFQLVINIFI